MITEPLLSQIYLGLLMIATVAFCIGVFELRAIRKILQARWQEINKPYKPGESYIDMITSIICRHSKNTSPDEPQDQSKISHGSDK